MPDVIFGFLPRDTLLLILAGAAVALTVLYLLREHRRRVLVPFGPMWKEATSEIRVSSLFRRLRRLWSLLLALLLAALLAVAAADPRPSSEAEEARSVVLLMDASASMQATDVAVAPNRLARAVGLALAYLETLRPQDVAMVVRLDARVAPLTPFTSDRAVLREALRSLHAVDTGADLVGALDLAVNALRGRPGPKLVVASDFAFRGAALAGLPDLASLGIAVERLRVGSSGLNVGITSFSVRRYLADWTAFEAYGAVRNFHDQPQRVAVRLFLDDRQIAERHLELAAGATAPLVEKELTSGAGAHGGRLTARVALLDGASDALPADDVAYAVMPPRKRLRVLLVGEANLFLEGALVVGASVSYERATCESFSPARVAEFDVTVFDGCAPDLGEAVGGARLLYLDVGRALPGAVWPWTTRRPLAFPELHPPRKEHPVLRWVSFKDVSVEEARPLIPAKGDRALMLVGSQPVALARSTKSPDGRVGRIVGLGLDVRRSDLPLRVSFPILVLNILDWLTEIDRSPYHASLRTGDVWHVPLPEGESVDAAELTLPSGGVRTVPVLDGAAVFSGGERGFHRLRAGAREVLVAANLANPDESDIRPPAIPPLAGVAARFDDVPHTLEWWFWLLAGALCITLFEWWSYNRRLTV